MAAIADLPDLARRATGGDETARAELVRELQPLVVRTARLIVGSGSPAAEDAAQDALVDLLRGLGSLRDPQAITAWACRIATRRTVHDSSGRRLRPPPRHPAPRPPRPPAAALPPVPDAMSVPPP